LGFLDFFEILENLGFVGGGGGALPLSSDFDFGGIRIYFGGIF